MQANPTLLQFSGGAAIPAALRAQKRWAPWRAEFNVKRGKFDKIPVRADDPRLGLSTANPAKWYTYDAALAAHTRTRGDTMGIGYCMTHPHGVVGVDLDGAVTEGVVDDWAAEIVTRLGGYAEFSPSGNGLRIFVEGEIAADYTNHQVGVEVYSGHTPRFLTVSGRHLPGTPTTLRAAPTGSLSWLAEKYRENALQKKARGDVPPMPLLLDAADIPRLTELNLPPRAHDFLAEGDMGPAGDRSRVLHSTAVALFSAGLSDVQAMSLLVNNPFAFEVALDHRRQDNERAMDYLWEHHVCAAKPKAMSSILTAADWADEIERDYEEREDEGDASGADRAVQVADGSSAALKPDAPRRRIVLELATAFAAKSDRLRYFIPGVLPEAELISVYGESAAGKSFITTHMMACVALARPFYGKPVRQAPVVYCALEGVKGMRLRLQAYMRHYGVDLGPQFWMLSGALSLSQPGDDERLIEALRARGPRGLLVVDTLAQATPGVDENASTGMGPVLARCRAIHEATGWTVLLVGHAGKNLSAGQRGWSGIKGALDCQLEVTKTATYRAMTVAKLKDGTGEGDAYTFEIADVVLNFDDEDGATVTAGVAIETHGKPVARGVSKRRSPTLGINQALIVRTLADLASAGKPRPHATDLLRAVVEQMTPPAEGKRDTRHQRASEALDALVADSALSLDGEHYVIHAEQRTELAVT